MPEAAARADSGCIRIPLLLSAVLALAPSMTLGQPAVSDDLRVYGQAGVVWTTGATTARRSVLTFGDFWQGAGHQWFAGGGVEKRRFTVGAETWFVPPLVAGTGNATRGASEEQSERQFWATVGREIARARRLRVRLLAGPGWVRVRSVQAAYVALPTYQSTSSEVFTHVVLGFTVGGDVDLVGGGPLQVAPLIRVQRIAAAGSSATTRPVSSPAEAAWRVLWGVSVRGRW